MLPTEFNNDAPIDLYLNGTIALSNITLGDKWNNDRGSWQPQHLYLTSDEEIKEGNWCLYNKNHNSRNPYWELFKCGKIENEEMHPISKGKLLLWCRKIVATTDKSLMTYIQPTGTVKGSLPQIPQQFQEEYCKAEGIDEVYVEMEKYASAEFPPTWKEDFLRFGIQHKPNIINKLKLNSNNCVITHPVEPKLYTKEEFEAKLIEISSEIFCEDGVLVGKSPADMYNWIKENLK